MKELFGLTEATISGEDLIKAILKANVDLLWFGGIGTYIKSGSESHIDVGDPANNSVRVNANGKGKSDRRRCKFGHYAKSSN